MAEAKRPHSLETKTMDQVRIEALDAGMVSAHMALARTTYQDPLASNPEHFWWKHGSGPYGPSTSVSLYDDEHKLTGRSLVQPRAFCVSQTESVRAGLVVDLLLAPGHRSAMTFITLVRNEAKVPDIDLLIHTSNATSEPLYRRLLRYPVAFDLKAYMLPLRIRRIVEKAFGWLAPAAFEALTAPWRLAISGAATLNDAGPVASPFQFRAGAPSRVNCAIVAG